MEQSTKVNGLVSKSMVTESRYGLTEHGTKDFGFTTRLREEASFGM